VTQDERYAALGMEQGLAIGSFCQKCGPDAQCQCDRSNSRMMWPPIRAQEWRNNWALARLAMQRRRIEPIPSGPLADGDVPLHGFDPGPFISYTKGLQNLVAHQQAQIAKLEQTVAACRAHIASSQFPADSEPETALNQLRYDRASGSAMLSGALAFIAGEARERAGGMVGEAAKWRCTGWDTADGAARNAAMDNVPTARNAPGEAQCDPPGPNDTTPDSVEHAVARRIDGVCADLMSGRTTPEQRRGLRSATDRADRITPGSDAAVGRAIG
jgi:hypothetical protein